MKKSLIVIATMLSAVAATQTASAQSTTTTSSTTMSADQPKAIGTSQQTANDAMQKAKQSPDKATLVRTGPSAADRAGDMTTKAKNKVDSASSAVKDEAHDATTTTKHSATSMKHKAKSATTTDADAGANSTTTTTVR